MTQKTIKIPVQRLNLEVDIPENAYVGDAGFDLHAASSLKIQPLSREVVDCGFALAIPKGYAGLVIPRSGLAAKNGISIVNSPGLIDSGYRGEIKVILYNTDKQNEFCVNFNDRIAQILFISYPNVSFENVSALEESERSQKGFGSSGLN